jgi:hypothetical protein
MVAEEYLHALLSLEKALFESDANVFFTAQSPGNRGPFSKAYRMGVCSSLITKHNINCPEDVMKFYWNMNTTIENLILKDITEANFRL